MGQGQLATRTVVVRAIGAAALVALVMTSWLAAGAQTEAATGLRVVHVGIDTPPVNVTLDDSLLAEGLLWLEATAYLNVTAGDHALAIFDPDTSLDEALATALVTTTAGNNYSAVITGELPEPTIVLLVDGDEGGLEAGMGAVRFFHSVPDAGALDIATSDGTVLVTGLAPMSASAYVMVAPGTYDIEFREAGTENVLYTEAGVTIAEGAFQTSYLSGLATLTNFAAETFVDEYRGGTGAEPTVTPAPEQPTATPEPEPTATPEPPPTATPAVGMPATGAGGMAAAADGASMLLLGSLAALCLAAGGGLLFWTRRAT